MKVISLFSKHSQVKKNQGEKGRVGRKMSFIVSSLIKLR